MPDYNRNSSADGQNKCARICTDMVLKSGCNVVQIVQNQRWNSMEIHKFEPDLFMLENRTWITLLNCCWTSSPLMYINTSLLKCIHTGIMYVPMCVMYANNYLKTIIWGSSRQEWKMPFRPSCCITDQLINRLDRSITKVCQCKKNCMVTFKLFGIIPLFPPKNPP